MSSNLKVNTILPSSGTAIGIGTASGNVDVLGHIVGHNTPNISGINSVTATTFYGSGANLTGISAGTSLSGSTNNTVCTVTGANAIQGEANLTFDGNDLSVTGTAPAINLIDTDSDDYKIHNVQGVLKITDTTASADRFVINDNGTGYFLSNFQIGSTTSSPGATLHVKTSYPSLKVDSGGHASDAYVRIISGNAQNSRLEFGDSDDDDIGMIDYDHANNSMSFLTSTSVRARILSNGNFGIGDRTSSPDQLLHVHTASGDSVIHVEAAADPKIRLRAHSGESIVQFADASSSNPGEINYVHSGDYLKFRVNASDRMLIDSGGHLQLQHGLTALSGGGVIVCAAKSSSGTANQSNYKVDFVVPMGDLGTKKEYEDIRAQFSSGQTGKDWTHALGGSGILIATVQNNYYWGFRTKIYHITTYGNSTNNVTQLNLLHNYSAAGHGANSAAVDLAVQSHDGKTPKLRATFSGDYWNSNVLTVTYIGSAVASTGNIRQTTTFDSKLTGQDTAWK